MKLYQNSRLGAIISTLHVFRFRRENELSIEFWGVIFLTKSFISGMAFRAQQQKGHFKKSLGLCQVSPKPS